MEQEIIVKMTEQEAVKYYANKIVEDSLSECSEFNCSKSIEEYSNNEFMKQHQEEILQVIKQDERVADVYLDKETKPYTYDMVFWTDYCLHYYEEYDLAKEKQVMILKKLVDQLIGIKKYSIGLSNTSTQQLIEGIINRNNFEKPLSIEEKEHAINMLKETICNTNFFYKYLDKYKLIVNKDNVVELIKELQEKLQSLEVHKKDKIKALSKQNLDTMLEIFNKNKICPTKYIGLFMRIEGNKYLGIDNTAGKMYIEEFDTEEECIKYLLNEDEEE